MREDTPRCSVDWGICHIQMSECFPEVFFNFRNQVQDELDSRRQQICHVIISSFDCNRSPACGTRCVQSMLLSLCGIQQEPSKSDASVSATCESLVEAENAIGHPVPDLDSPGL